MKTILFIPGNKENIASRDYPKTLKAIEECGYKVIFVPTTWHYRAPDQWLEEFNKTYLQHKAEDVIIAGFSFGAVIALMASARHNPSELWLFSLSPYFAEDFPLPPSWYKWHGAKIIENFKRLIFKNFTSKIKCPTISFVGEIEAKTYPSLDARTRAAANEIPHAKFILIPKTGHDVTDDNYIQAIKNGVPRGR